MRILKIITWIVVGLILLGIGIWMVVSKNLFGGLIILIGFWTLMSIKIIGPAQIAVLVLLGAPIGFRDSGPNFVPWLLAKLVRFPKKMYNFDYRKRKFVSRAGEYKGIYYGSQVLIVDAVAYLNLPREIRSPKDGEEVDDITHPLIKILRNNIPIKDEELKDWTNEAVAETLRVAFGQITWKQAMEEKETEEGDDKTLNKRAEKIFKRVDGPLIRAGFSKKGIGLVIAEIELPLPLQEALAKVDQERLKADAANFVVKRQVKEWIGMILETMAQSRGKSVKEIQTEIDDSEKLQREFLDYAKMINLRLEEAEREALVHVVVDGEADEGKSNGFLDKFAKMAIKIFAAKERMPMGGKEPPGPKKEGSKEETEEEKDEKFFEDIAEESRTLKKVKAR